MMSHGLRDDPRLLRPHALLAGRDVLGSFRDVLEHLAPLLLAVAREVVQPRALAFDFFLVFFFQII